MGSDHDRSEPCGAAIDDSGQATLVVAGFYVVCERMGTLCIGGGREIAQQFHGFSGLVMTGERPADTQGFQGAGGESVLEMAGKQELRPAGRQRRFGRVQAAVMNHDRGLFEHVRQRRGFVVDRHAGAARRIDRARDARRR